MSETITNRTCTRKVTSRTKVLTTAVQDSTSRGIGKSGTHLSLSIWGHNDRSSMRRHAQDRVAMVRLIS
jgi:hypothetical protein